MHEYIIFSKIPKSEFEDFRKLQNLKLRTEEYENTSKNKNRRLYLSIGDRIAIAASNGIFIVAITEIE
jgi:hypothetical protein